MKKKQWIVYGTLLFIIFLGLTEIALSFALFSVLSPTSSVLFVTPVAFFTSAMFAGVISLVYLMAMLYVVRKRVFVKGEEGVVYNQDEAIYLLPFYLVSGVSLSIHLGYTPMNVHHVFTFVFFAVFAESCYEYIHLVDFKDISKLDLRKTFSTATIIILLLAVLVPGSTFVGMADGDSEDGEIRADLYPTDIELEAPEELEAGDSLELDEGRINLKERLDEDDDREVENITWVIEKDGRVVGSGEDELVHEFDDAGTYTIYVEAGCSVLGDTNHEGEAVYQAEADVEVTSDSIGDFVIYLFLAVLILAILLFLAYMKRREDDEDEEEDSEGGSSSSDGQDDEIGEEDTSTSEDEDIDDLFDDLENVVEEDGDVAE